MEYYVNINELKAELARKGYNISSFSDALGASRSTVSAVLNGKKPTYEFMQRTMQILELDTERGMAIFFATKLT